MGGDTQRNHDELCREKISVLILPRKQVGYWVGGYADRNHVVANQRQCALEMEEQITTVVQ